MFSRSLVAVSFIAEIYTYVQSLASVRTYPVRPRLVGASLRGTWTRCLTRPVADETVMGVPLSPHHTPETS